MALIKCKECGREISKKAKTCPGCGANNIQISIITKVFCTFFGLIVLIGLLAGPDRDAGTSTDSPVLELITYACNKEHGYMIFTGEVKNISNRPLKNVMVVGSLYTKKDTFVKTAEALIDYNPILPGQKSPFRAGSTDNPVIQKCDVSFKTLGGGELTIKTVEKLRTKQNK